MDKHKIMMEIEGRICDSLEFESVKDAVQTGVELLKKGAYQNGDLIVVRVFDDGKIIVAEAPRYNKPEYR